MAHIADEDLKWMRMQEQLLLEACALLEERARRLLKELDHPAWPNYEERVRQACNGVADSYSAVNEYRRYLEDQVKELPRPGPRAKKPPTDRTLERAQVFQRLKQQHPDWGQARLALEAQGELGEIVTAETVRNTYRAMGWPWPAGQRAR